MTPAHPSSEISSINSARAAARHRSGPRIIMSIFMLVVRPMISLLLTLATRFPNSVLTIDRAAGCRAVKKTPAEAHFPAMLSNREVAPGNSARKSGMRVQQREVVKVRYHAMVIWQQHRQRRSATALKMDMMMRDHYDAAPPHRALLMEEIQKMMAGGHVTLLLKEGTTTAWRWRRREVTPGGRRDVRPPFHAPTSLLVWAADPQRKPGDRRARWNSISDEMKLTSDTITLVKENGLDRARRETSGVGSGYI